MINHSHTKALSTNYDRNMHQIWGSLRTKLQGWEYIKLGGMKARAKPAYIYVLEKPAIATDFTQKTMNQGTVNG